MTPDVIGSRYVLDEVRARANDVTTWSAHDTWLDTDVFVAVPEGTGQAGFAAVVAAMHDTGSSPLLPLYDVDAPSPSFAAFGIPAGVLADAPAAWAEDEVLRLGMALASALSVLHERGIVHGAVHPGAVVIMHDGSHALAPWPLAAEPPGWTGTAEIGNESAGGHVRDENGDLRSLGAVMLAALAGPLPRSSEQIGTLDGDFGDRAPAAVEIARRALSADDPGGYRSAAEIGAACAAALSDVTSSAAADAALPSETSEAAADGPGPTAHEPAADSSIPEDPSSTEGHRVAAVVAAAAAALVAALVLSETGGSRVALPRPAVHPCIVTDSSGSTCVGPLPGHPAASAARVRAAGPPGSTASAPGASATTPGGHPSSNGAPPPKPPAHGALPSAKTAAPTTGAGPVVSTTTTTAVTTTTQPSSTTSSTSTTSTSTTTTTTTQPPSTTSTTAMAPAPSGRTGTDEFGGSA